MDDIIVDDIILGPPVNVPSARLGLFSQPFFKEEFRSERREDNGARRFRQEDHFSAEVTQHGDCNQRRGLF